MELVIRSCSECPWLYYNHGLLKCTFNANLCIRNKDDPRFPLDCPIKNGKLTIKIEPLKTCEKCKWRQEKYCTLYNGKITLLNNKHIRLPICLRNEKK